MRAFKNFVKTSKGRLILCVLSVGLISFTTSNEKANAGDGKTTANIAKGLGGAMAGLGAVDLVASVAHCICKATTSGTCTPTIPWAPCETTGVNAMAMMGGLMSMLQSGSSEGAMTGGGNGGFGINGNFDPNTPLAQVIGCPPGDANCDCSSSNNASYNPMCGPQAIQNVKDQITKVSAGLKDGSLLPPDGKTVDEMLAANSQAENALDSLLKGKIPDAGDSAGIGDNVAGTQNGGGGQGGSGSGGEILAGGSDGGGSGANGRNAGPVDRAGLGRVTMVNGLDVIDDATGKSLTIWQRLTRRHQGDEKGSRAFLMAKIEVMRKHALGAQTMSKTASAKPVEAARAPSSVKPASPAKLDQKH